MDWTHRFKKVSRDARHVKAASAVIDGEIVVPAVDGTTDFSVLQNELKGQFTKIVVVDREGAVRIALDPRNQV